MKTVNFDKSKMGTMLAVNQNIKTNSNNTRVINDKNLIESLLKQKD